MIYRPQREKTCLRGSVNKKGADQLMHPHIQISAFVIHAFVIHLQVITNEISLFAVAEETGLSLAFSKTPNTRFAASMLIHCNQSLPD